MCNIVVFALVFAYFLLFELAGFEELRNACGQVDVQYRYLHTSIELATEGITSENSEKISAS